MPQPQIKREDSPTRSAPLIRIINNPEFNKSTNIKQECEIHIIDFARTSNLQPKIYDEFTFDRIKSEPELQITDCLEIEDTKEVKNDSKLKVFEIYGNFQRLEPSKWEENVFKKIIQRYFCEYCDKSFKRPNGLILHKASAHKNLKKPTNFICDFCGKVCSDKPKLLVHMKIHETRVNCKICHKSMIPVSLYFHMKEVHGQHSKYKCPLCEKISNSEKKFKQHQKTHVKKFECKYCNKIFSASYRYNQHMMWHEDSNAFSCQICGKTFSRRANLNEHQKVHNKDRVKNHKCTKCNFSTIYPKSLRYHLAKHKKNEEREKKLKKSKTAVQCKICFLFLIHKNSLVNHISQVHTEAKFNCDICGICTKTKGAIFRHMIRFHLK